MLELQNSMPKIFMNPDDAKERGLEAGDLVEAYNGRGKCQGGLVLDPGMYPGQAIFDQGWWSEYMDGDSYMSVYCKRAVRVRRSCNEIRNGHRP